MRWNNCFYIKIMLMMSVLFLINSCSDEDIQTSVVHKTVDEIINDWRYYGFGIYFDKYNPSENYLDSIDKHFDPEIYKFILYTSPSCFSCGQMDSLLPQTSKILKASKLPDTTYILFDTPGISSSHPYDSTIFLKKLPSAYLLNSGTNDIFSILDTFRIRKENEINTSLEQIMYEFLK